MARKNPHSPEKLAETQRNRNLALELRLAGKTQKQIAEETGWSKQRVSVYIRDAIKDITRENAEEYVEIMNQRFDAMLAGIWNDATHGDTWKIDRALAIEDQRARLLGLYKTAELKAVADAKGNVAEDASSMVSALVAAFDTYAQGKAQADPEDGDDTDEQDEAE
ncbi:helix-turn-helix domain-containing protein [Nocardia asiatica]